MARSLTGWPEKPRPPAPLSWRHDIVEVAKQGRAAVGFDFAVVEGCQVYDECESYIDAYAGRVLDIEYTDTGRGPFAAACTAHRGEISIILRDRDLVPRGKYGYVYATC